MGAIVPTDLAPGPDGQLNAADRHWLGQAIELSRRCPPSASAYCVGAVLVGSDGAVLATGFSREHDPYDHAEEAALALVDPADPRLASATLYSSLEPCRFRASRPVPCAELIIAGRAAPGGGGLAGAPGAGAGRRRGTAPRPGHHRAGSPGTGRRGPGRERRRARRGARRGLSMGYQLRMSGEIHDWLDQLRTADPARARLVAEALAALAAGGASLGPPLVQPADPDHPGPAEAELDPRAQLDQAYQDQLDQLATLRRRVADAATLARQFSTQLGDLGSLRVRLAEQRQEAQRGRRRRPGRHGAAGHRRRGPPAGLAARAAAPGDVGRAGPGPAELPAAGAHRGAAGQEGNAQGAVHRRRGRVHGGPGHRGAGCRPGRRAGPGTGRRPAGDHRRRRAAKLQAIAAEIEDELHRAGQPASAAGLPALLELRPEVPAGRRAAGRRPASCSRSSRRAPRC